MNGNNCTDETRCLTDSQIMFYNVTLPIISATGLLVNLVVIFGILSRKTLRQNIANIFIVNLAFADILVLVIGVPLWVYQLSANESLISCQFTYGVTNAAGGISLLTLGAISLDRYYAVTNPFSYHVLMTKKRALVTVGILWLVAVSVSLFMVVGWKSKKQPLESEVIKYCVYTRVFREELLLSNFAVASIIILMNVTFYCRLLKVARHHARRINITKEDLSTNQPSRSTSIVNQGLRRERNLKATRTLGIILGVLLCCWVPFVIVAFIDISSPSFRISVFTVKTLGTITYVNSILDPVIYTFMSRDFKRTMKRAIMRRMTLAGLEPTGRLYTSSS